MFFNIDIIKDGTDPKEKVEVLRYIDNIALFAENKDIKDFTRKLKPVFANY